MTLRTISWILYLVGIALVFGGYVNLVSPGVSWIGWLVGMTGWLMGFIQKKGQTSKVTELERLSVLHQSGQLTDEEFSKAKANIVGPDSYPPDQ
jgi:hypothetical protein